MAAESHSWPCLTKTILTVRKSPKKPKLEMTCFIAQFLCRQFLWCSLWQPQSVHNATVHWISWWESSPVSAGLLSFVRKRLWETWAVTAERSHSYLTSCQPLRSKLKCSQGHTVTFRPCVCVCVCVCMCVSALLQLSLWEPIFSHLSFEFFWQAFEGLFEG